MNPFLMGLIEPQKLTPDTTTKSLGGKTPDLGVALGAHRGADGGTVGKAKNCPKPSHSKTPSDDELETFGNAPLEYENIATPYRMDAPYLLAADRGNGKMEV